ncbi:hypothetical protein [Streptomyces sp. NPDC058280]|uniref:hypothetical protein n=1 Tax=Streptomyces sp. NPDC058280 TaxID=3346419 RepID=UPI0036E846E8
MRWRRETSTGKLTSERVYLVTSLSVFDATCTEPAIWIRGHWGIENLLHHVRDLTFREDDSKIPTGTLPAPRLPCTTSPSAVLSCFNRPGAGAIMRGRVLGHDR